MEQEDTKSTINNNIEDGDTQIFEESLFVDSSDAFESDHPLSIAKPSSISDLYNINVAGPIKSEETSSSSSSADLHHTQLDSQQSSKEISLFHSFKKPASSVDFPMNDCESSYSMKDDEKLKTKLNPTRLLSSSSSHLKSVNEDTSGYSAITSVSDDERIDDDSITADSPSSGSNFLYSLAGLVIKMIGFQLNLLATSVTFPVSVIYYSYLFVLDPFRITNRAKHYILGNLSKIISLCCNSVTSTISIWIKKHESTWKLCGRLGWGFFWSIYVGFILISLLTFAFLVSGITLKCIIEEPIQITEQLHFDYTKDSPIAFVPLMSCPDSDSSFLECTDLIRSGYSDETRVIPLDHKVHATVSLTLPESYYNQDLGIFQVRIDFLSNSGKSLASTRQPCMLQFKSQPIRLILTFLNLAPIITGYSSESQTLKIKFRGYTETNDPTSCLRVILEQRAEFTSGAGVPELYEASLKLESQPPFFKWILWYWKGMIYVWVTVMMFIVELLFVLICCTPVIAPWTRGVSVNNNLSQNTIVGPK